MTLSGGASLLLVCCICSMCSAEGCRATATTTFTPLAHVGGEQGPAQEPLLSSMLNAL